MSDAPLGNPLPLTGIDEPERGYDARSFVPESTDLAVLEQAAQACRGCPLHEPATQTVFGRGAASASLILVGEQPGDVEDRRGEPFVGPAGGVLWDCVERAGLDRNDVYTTNAVKHFKFELRGTRRLHQKPTTKEVNACLPWLTAELGATSGSVIVALGATAARSLLGRPTPIASNRSRRFEVAGRATFVTYHPSAVLRADDAAEAIRTALIDDLRAAAQHRHSS